MGGLGRRCAKVEHQCAIKGVAPPPIELTQEERSWDGGPGFNVALANAGGVVYIATIPFVLLFLSYAGGLFSFGYGDTGNF